ncbi:MAG: baseplate J protein, partial [Gammaproteobacteria bacterium]|nr:baseplate J protein [Gammaproteobacteria bacterium]
TIALNPNTTAVQQAVEAELKEMLRSTSSPGGTVLLSKLNEAVSAATGEIDHAISDPVTDVTHTINQIPTLGTITWLAL